MSMTTGHDVGKNRLDDLDRIIIRASMAEPFTPQTICNFGSGESRLSVTLGDIGHQIYNYDSRDLSLFFDLQKERGQKQIFTHIDLDHIKKHLLPKQIDVCVFQRVLHYLRYSQTQKILQLVSHRMILRGTIYISFSGLNTEIGKTYTASDQPIESRWGSIDPEYQQKFSIEQNVCLYTQSDVEQLVSSIDGLEIEKIWTSEFGNIKVIVNKCN